MAHEMVTWEALQDKQALAVTVGEGQSSWEREGSGPIKAKRQKLAHRVWETVSVWE